MIEGLMDLLCVQWIPWVSLWGPRNLPWDPGHPGSEGLAMELQCSFWAREAQIAALREEKAAREERHMRDVAELEAMSN